MEKSGETCALAGSFKIAEKILEETTEIEEIIAKVNDQVPWCGKWKLKGNKISSICLECGDTCIGNNPFIMLDIFYPLRKDFIKKLK